ncbi:hypothetical protein [Sulfobacillus thermosulfidooxidans]|uniref:hypothetical protein n=1 Tax=Sulfobacillus thermosulfidooxidans TaxID=28034 RepID=UPI0006B5B3F3|nr:hypothetical protein [Sulfobacillus thermosulfidooxidans]
MAHVMAWWVARMPQARGSVNLPQILWVVFGLLIGGGAILWLTAGGGITAIKNLLTNITNLFNTAVQTL